MIYTADVEILKNEDYFEYYRNALPGFRREKLEGIRPLNSKCLSLGASVLLTRSLLDRGLDPYGITCSYKGNQKPCLPDYPDLHFNLSHSGSRVMCIIGCSENGCDIEQIKAYRPEITHRFFHNEESAFLDGLSDYETKRRSFYRIWTLKECFMKVTGLGMSLDMRSFAITLPGFHTMSPLLPEIRQTYNNDNYYFKEYNVDNDYCCSAVSLSDDLPEDFTEVNLAEYVI